MTPVFENAKPCQPAAYKLPNIYKFMKIQLTLTGIESLPCQYQTDTPIISSQQADS